MCACEFSVLSDHKKKVKVSFQKVLNASTTAEFVCVCMARVYINPIYSLFNNIGEFVCSALGLA